MKPIITLLTDFGNKDAYVSSMKGVILAISREVCMVDISHEVGAQNVREAAWILLSAYRYFPAGTIHVVVVDPGVGSRRRILCARTRAGYFLAPDNGVLSPVLEREGTFTLREVRNPEFFRKEVSATFHGRDKFAPVAAHLARAGRSGRQEQAAGGGSPEPARASRLKIFSRLGPVVRGYERLRWPRPQFSGRKIEAEILHIDCFGNLVTNVERGWIASKKTRPEIRLGRYRIRRWAPYYAEGREGELIALINSAGHVEIAASQGSAAGKTKARVGDPVLLEWR